MKFRKALADAIGKLQRTKKNGEGPRHSMRQQPPAEWMIVLPDRVGAMDEKTLVVDENIPQHQGDKSEQNVLGTEVRRSSNRDRSSGHLGAPCGRLRAGAGAAGADYSNMKRCLRK